jgi:hypothetical protein
MNKRILILITLVCAAITSVQSVRAATITVTNINDSGAGSLRQALADANDGDTINFSVTTPASITLTSGELLVDKSVTINGPGADQLSVDGNAASTVFHISPHITVTISGLTITNGRGSILVPTGEDYLAGGGIYNDHATLTVNSCSVTGNSCPDYCYGGGIENNGTWYDPATLTITNSTISGNSADSGGGGILNDGSEHGSATLTIDNTIISGNSANIVGGGGGGIYNYGLYGSATLIVNNSTLSGNSGGDYGHGGGIRNEGSGGSATLTITNSILSGNSAGTGGGAVFQYIYGGSATMSVSNSTLSDNSANSGGGILNNQSITISNSTLSDNSANTGAGIYNDNGGSMTISNSTLSGNSATEAGSGSIHNGGSLTITNSTLSGNSAPYIGGIYNDDRFAASLTIGHSIMNTGASGANVYGASGTVTSLGYNLSSDDASAFLNATGDQNSTDPMLGALQDNGGPTFTHALSCESPAIDAGDPSFTPPPDYDQRGAGFDRVVNGRIDIGAFELQSTRYSALVQPPINDDGTSIFNVRRGVVPVKFTLREGCDGEGETCDLPPATIALTRTGGGVAGEVNESDYIGPSDSGSDFRIEGCQYHYNLYSSTLGAGTYRVDILIDNQVVGSATFQLD